MNFFDPYEALPDTKDYLSDTTVVISKLIELKMGKSTVNINLHWGELNCLICTAEVEIPSFLQQGVALQAKFSAVNSPGWNQAEE